MELLPSTTVAFLIPNPITSPLAKPTETSHSTTEALPCRETFDAIHDSTRHTHDSYHAHYPHHRHHPNTYSVTEFMGRREL